MLVTVPSHKHGLTAYPLTNSQLILGMAADLHAQPVSTAVSASVTRLAAAIRMVSFPDSMLFLRSFRPDTLDKRRKIWVCIARVSRHRRTRTRWKTSNYDDGSGLHVCFLIDGKFSVYRQGSELYSLLI